MYNIILSVVLSVIRTFRRNQDSYTLSEAWSGVNWADLMAAQGAFGTEFFYRSTTRTIIIIIIIITEGLEITATNRSIVSPY